MSAETYGQILSEVIDDMCKTRDRSDVMRICGILLGHYYNVINPDKKTSGGNPFCCPAEWAVAATKESKNYKLLETIVKDCGCALLTPDDIQRLKGVNVLDNTLHVIKDLAGKVGQ